MTGYPVILCGDHAEFEAEWAASGKPDSERPDWPLPSFDAQDWAAAFCKIATDLGYKDADGKPIDEGWMISWFANSLMRGYDQRSAECSAMLGALEEISEPLTVLQLRAERAGERLDVDVAKRLENDANYLRGIARKAIGQ